MTDHEPSDPAAEKPGDLSRRRLLAGAGLLAASSTLGVVRPTPAGAAPAQVPGPPVGGVGARNFPDGPGAGVTLGDGAWCVWPHSRAIMHEDGRLFVGVVRPIGSLNSAMEVLAADMRRLRVTERFELGRLPGRLPDDHTSPGLIKVGPQVQAGWSGHYASDDLIRVGTSLRRPLVQINTGAGSCYTQHRATPGMRWIAYRTRDGWAIMSSVNAGGTWTQHGIITTPGTGLRPYVCFTADRVAGVLHFLVSDSAAHHGASVFAGIIHPDLTITDSEGAPLGLVGRSPVDPRSLTPVKMSEFDLDGGVIRTCRNIDMVMAGGQPQAILSTREPGPRDGPPPNGDHWHRCWVTRRQPDGTWDLEPLGWAGSELSRSSIDYTGLAVTDPTNQNRIVMSSDVYPSCGATTGTRRWELYEMTRQPEGYWDAVSLTRNSSHDNMRPTIAAAGNHKALAWMRGTYTSYTRFNTQLCARRA